MKPDILTLTIVTIFLAALATPTGSTAQQVQAQSHKYHHYQLIDMGTFGGPQSYLVFESTGMSLSKDGTVAGWADTAMPDPFAPFCFNDDCYVSHTFRSQNGVKTDLGSLLGAGSSDAWYISDSGLIASDAENGQLDPLLSGFPQIHAVLWDNGVVTDLGTLPEGGNQSNPTAVNDHAQVVGVAANTIPDPNSMLTGYPTQARAFFWQNGVMQDLGTLGGTDAQADLINNRGQVVGVSYVSSIASPRCAESGLVLATDSFIWENGKGMEDLGSLGGTCTLVAALNNRGEVVGQSELTGGMADHAFYWERKTGFTDLGTLPGGNYSAGYAINEAGVVVGGATTPESPDYGNAALWQNNEGTWQITNLGTVDDSNCSFALSINGKSQVVGVSGFECNAKAFLWEDGGPMVNLNNLVPQGSGLALVAALVINDRGEIAVTARDGAGNDRAVLLIPCDENHPGVDGCDYSLVDVTEAAVGPTQAMEPRATKNENSPTGHSRQFRTRSARRFPLSGIQPQKVAGFTNASTPDRGVEAIMTSGPERFVRRGKCDVESNGLLTGYCHTSGIAPDSCHINRDVTDCKPGQKAKRPEWVSGCLPPSTFRADLDTHCSWTGQ
jgi:probable HAF family extracellular repeat protein